MSKAITVRVDEAIKHQADEMLNEIGLNMSTYINSSLRALVRERKIPFELTTKHQANDDYLAKLNESMAQAERGEVVKYTMEELKALVDGE